jgi:hypothetical protein
MKEKKICAFPNIKNHDKKCSIISHNLFDKNTIVRSMVNFCSYFVLECIFIKSLPNSLHNFTFVLSCLLYMQLSHNIYIFAKNHTNLYKFMIFETKKNDGRNKNEIEYHE